MLSTSELDLISESEGRCHCTFGIKTTKLISDKYWGGGGGGRGCSSSFMVKYWCWRRETEETETD